MKLKKLTLLMTSISLPTAASIINIQCYRNDNKMEKAKKLLELNLHKSFNFFQNVMNKNINSGYGMVPDRYFINNPSQISSYHQSNDALGWLLCSIVIGVEKNYITKQEGLIQTKKIIKTIMQLPHHYGFPVHFSNRDGTARAGSEYSSATAFLIFGGLIVASNYFSDKEINEDVQNYINRIDWSKWVIKKNNKTYIKMSYQKEAGDYGDKGYHGLWDMSAEQQLLYLLYAAGKNDSQTSKHIYRSFNRKKTGLVDQFVQEPGGTLFTYQFSHMYINFQKVSTNDGVDWFKNTQLAIKQDQKYSKKLLEKKFSMTSDKYWGLTANDGANGNYRVAGTNKPIRNFDGWFAPWAKIGSISYIKQAPIQIYDLKNNIPNSWNEKYGFLDGYSPVTKKSSQTILPLDKGMAMVATINYQNNLIWNVFMNSQIIKNAMLKLGWIWK